MENVVLYSRQEKGAFSIYRQIDPRALPAYTVSEAAHYLLIPRATLASWVAGRPYPTRAGIKFFRPVLLLPERRNHQLSFVNLVEAHVLNAIRHEHNIAFDKVRKSVEYLRRQFGSKHPLAEYKFETDGIDLFVQRYGELINTSREGQMAMREVLHWFLHRVERDESGFPVKLYPFTRKATPDAPKTIVIDPRLSFGRPVIAGSGIPTSIVAERYKAGDSIQQLAQDYSRPACDIEEAIRCELQLEAA